MKRVWDTLALIVVTIFVLNIMLKMIRPYVPMLLLVAVVWFLGMRTYERYRNW